MKRSISFLLSFLRKCIAAGSRSKSKGRPRVYSTTSIVVFFTVMMLKKIYTFKGMEKYARQHDHYKLYGWKSCPSRKTLRRRFKELPQDLKVLMPLIAAHCATLDQQFSYGWAFVDKTLVCADGGVWHRSQIKQGFVPHRRIDREASWGYSPYHKWRFGYGLHVICNEQRFPICCTVTTGKAKDHLQLEALVATIIDKPSMVVGDAGYFARRELKKLHEQHQVLGFCHKLFKNVTPKQDFEQYYNQMVATPQARVLYSKRKGSIEPVFALIKELFALQEKKTLPYKGLAKVSAFLSLTACTLQMMMYFNFKHKRKLREVSTFRNNFI